MRVDRPARQRAWPCEHRRVDSTAAGDAFLDALAATLAERGLDEALIAASGAGVLAASRMGAQPSLPTREEVDAFVLARQFGRSRL